MAAEHDYEGFMEEELAARESMGYPPFGRMLMLRLWGARQEAAREAADEAARELAGSAGFARDPGPGAGALADRPGQAPVPLPAPAGRPLRVPLRGVASRTFCAPCARRPGKPASASRPTPTRTT